MEKTRSICLTIFIFFFGVDLTAEVQSEFKVHLLDSDDADLRDKKSCAERNTVCEDNDDDEQNLPILLRQEIKRDDLLRVIGLDSEDIQKIKNLSLKDIFKIRNCKLHDIDQVRKLLKAGLTSAEVRRLKKMFEDKLSSSELEDIRVMIQEHAYGSTDGRYYKREIFQLAAIYISTSLGFFALFFLIFGI